MQSQLLPGVHEARAYGTLVRMRPGALVLVQGPLDPVNWWERQRLDLPSDAVTVPQPVAGGSPHAVRWLATAAHALRANALSSPLVLVGHGTAGPLLPALAGTQRAAGRRVGGYVFVDATLPRPGSATHLDLLAASDLAVASAAHEALHEPGGTWPPDAATPLDHGFWTETLPAVVDWPDAPCGYLRTGSEEPGVGSTTFWARSARSRGWLVEDGTDLAALLATVVSALPG